MGTFSVEYSTLQLLNDVPISKWRVIIAVNFPILANGRKKPENITASTGFELVTSATPVRCSTNWAVKPHIGGEVNLLSWYLPVQWNIHEIHICTAVVYETEEKSDHRSKFLLEEKEEAVQICRHRATTTSCSVWPIKLLAPGKPITTQLWTFPLKSSQHGFLTTYHRLLSQDEKR